MRVIERVTGRGSRAQPTWRVECGVCGDVYVTTGSRRAVERRERCRGCYVELIRVALRNACGRPVDEMKREA